MFKQVFIVLAPLLLAVLELFHPHGFGAHVYTMLLPDLTLWLFIHVMQLVLFGTAAVVFLLMIEGMKGILVQFSRFFIWAFVVFYTAYDSVAGIGTGLILRIGKNHPELDQQTLHQLVQSYFFDPYFGGSHSWLSETASLAALLAIWGVAATLWVNRFPKVPLLLYVLAGPILWVSHAVPYGPAAFTLIAIANLWFILSARACSSTHK